MPPPCERTALKEPTILDQWIDEHREEQIDFTRRLVATPSPNLPGDERAVAEVVVSELKRLGLTDIEVAAQKPHRPNVICRHRGRGGGPTLMLCGHSDTKPIGDASRWQTDPLDPIIRDGKMYGLGTTDMKGAVAAMIYATAAIKQCNVELDGDVLLVVNADEERSMAAGSKYLAEEYGIEATVCLLCEPCAISGPEFEFLHLLSRGICCFHIRVRGTQMHSSLSDRLPSVNASVKMAQVLTAMQERLQLTFEPHPLCAAPTVNLAVKVEAGVGFGVYPGTAEFQCDIRTLPGMTQKQIEADVQKLLEQLRNADPDLDVEFEFEQSSLQWIRPTEVPADHPFVEVLLDAAQSVLGRRPKLTAFPGGTDANNFQGVAGIPTIPSFGPGWLTLAHGPNECVGVESLIQAAKIYALAARNYLGGTNA